MKILEQEKFRKLGSDKAESEKLKVTKRKVEQQLKKKIYKFKLRKPTKIGRKTQKERAVWMKVGQRVRIGVLHQLGTIETIHKNGKVTVNYGLLKRKFLKTVGENLIMKKKLSLIERIGQINFSNNMHDY